MSWEDWAEHFGTKSIEELNNIASAISDLLNIEPFLLAGLPKLIGLEKLIQVELQAREIK